MYSFTSRLYSYYNVFGLVLNNLYCSMQQFSLLFQLSNTLLKYSFKCWFKIKKIRKRYFWSLVVLTFFTLFVHNILSSHWFDNIFKSHIQTSDTLYLLLNYARWRTFSCLGVRHTCTFEPWIKENKTERLWKLSGLLSHASTWVQFSLRRMCFMVYNLCKRKFNFCTVKRKMVAWASMYEVC